jgi:hypothetical protein
LPVAQAEPAATHDGETSKINGLQLAAAAGTALAKGIAVTRANAWEKRSMHELA